MGVRRLSILVHRKCFNHPTAESLEQPANVDSSPRRTDLFYVSSFGSVPLKGDGFAHAAVFTGTQKAAEFPAGIAVAAGRRLYCGSRPW